MPCLVSIASIVSRTIASYSVTCSAVSGTNRSVSVLRGSSGAMPGSVFLRRSRNGRIRAANLAVASASRYRSTGTATRRVNASRWPSRPGVVQSRIAHSSDSRFSTGVPVSAILAGAGTARSSRAVRDSGFFACCASSATTRPQPTSASRAESRSTTP